MRVGIELVRFLIGKTRARHVPLAGEPTFLEQPDARILVLDNHDDFGGHAKRNEFVVGGKLLALNGAYARYQRLSGREGKEA